MRARAATALLVVAAVVLALFPAGAGAAPALPDLSQQPVPIARDLLPGDAVPADRNPDVPLRAADAPDAALFGTALAEASGTAACDYDAYPEDPDDAAIKLGLIPYHEIAPKLCELETGSDRVSVEVIGQSTQGRDLHLVTVTAPETAQEAARQDELHALRLTDPSGAIARFAEYEADYKTPMLVNNNIHGNEWEGTDASLEVIEDLAFTDDHDQLALLDDARLYFIITANPDGRVAGTRANGAGFDMNRDFITQSQPETRAMRDVIVTTTPLIMLDIHGYTVTTLIEPCTKPHNDDYEYDLYIKWAMPQAEAMEDEVMTRGLTQAPAAISTGVEIPYRDRDEGWDDWPPIFTPMFSILQGAIGHTIEVPIPVNTLYSSPAPALQEMSRQNTVVARASIEAAFAFANDNRSEMLRDQLEVFRRGSAGEDSPGNDGGGNAIWAAQSYPQGYVIPAGAGQRSATAAARLVDFLLANGVQVRRATAAFSAGGATHPAGSYVVDLRQARRGMANTILGPGRDISPDVASMYDISGWSPGLVWGATVTAAPTLPAVASQPVVAAGPTGGVEEGSPAAYGLVIDDFAGLRALGQLHDAGVTVERAPDGTVVLPASARPTLVEVADRTGVRFSALDAEPADRERLHRLRVAAAATAQERHALDEMDIDFTLVSTNALNGGFSLDGFDVLFVASGLSYSGLNDTGRAEVDAFLARDGGVVGRGSAGAVFNDDADLLDVSRQSGPGGANGVVAVRNNQQSPVTGASDGQGHSFVYSPLWFTELGDGVRADQRLGDGNPLVAGHWRGSGASTPQSAAGHALVVSGTADAARVVLFGSEPLFRAHPKGLYREVADAFLWSAQFPSADGTGPGGPGGEPGDPTDPDADPQQSPSVSRLDGENRFETAAAVSRATFESGIEVVYLATGASFADALAGGPAAISGRGPVLLVTRDEVPTATNDELARLRPGRIVLLGGPEAISAAVEGTLRRHTDGPVDRLWGPTRFETAVEVSRATFFPGSPVYVATGLNHPDALAGGVAAGVVDGPVLLVRPDAVPAAVEAELERLEPPVITILGGPSAVSPAVEVALRRHAPLLARTWGDNRYGTAAEISQDAFADGTRTAYVATGLDFADALAGVPAAGLRPAPVLLVGRDAVPEETAEELRRLGVRTIVILGGPAAVSHAVAGELRRLIGAD